jgi:hypothetical protein
MPLLPLLLLLLLVPAASEMPVCSESKSDKNRKHMDNTYEPDSDGRSRCLYPKEPTAGWHSLGHIVAIEDDKTLKYTRDKKEHSFVLVKTHTGDKFWRPLHGLQTHAYQPLKNYLRESKLWINKGVLESVEAAPTPMPVPQMPTITYGEKLSLVNEIQSLSDESENKLTRMLIDEGYVAEGNPGEEVEVDIFSDNFPRLTFNRMREIVALLKEHEEPPTPPPF